MQLAQVTELVKGRTEFYLVKIKALILNHYFTKLILTFYSKLNSQSVCTTPSYMTLGKVLQLPLISVLSSLK